MKVVILCGGRGTRLVEVVPDRPKVLADVNGKPFLHYLLKKVSSEGFKEVILCVGHGADKIKEYIGEEKERIDQRNRMSPRNLPFLDLLIEYSQDADLGTGGALRNAAPLIGEGRCIVLNGDTWCDVELKNLIRLHDQFSYHSLICRFNQNNAGVYILPEGFVTRVIPEGISDLDRVLWARSLPMMSEVAGFIDMGTPSGYSKTKKILQEIYP